nr:voltage-dependent calcium channel subunit alpha-2/delta-1 [Pogona vitticeps]
MQRLIPNKSLCIALKTVEQATIVLNELNWTAALDDVFKKNREEDQTLLWQVFGSATGLARYYPASPWVDKSRTQNKIDLYDVRRRPWYIQGAASPKDMLILVDASGSVSGLTLKLIRTSVIEMLETLSDDDFVNVVSFNENAQNVSCFNQLVQANVRNKKKLKEAVYKIQAKGITDYKKGFSYAFEQLLNHNHSVFRANCNKIIMLFTDGGEEKAQEIFQKYNRDKKVRVFTFSVGQHNYDKGPIQWMACENKGYYYEIPSIGAIRINTQEYLDVLGRPMVLAGKQAKQVQWTNVYLDALGFPVQYSAHDQMATISCGSFCISLVYSYENKGFTVIMIKSRSNPLVLFSGFFIISFSFVSLLYLLEWDMDCNAPYATAMPPCMLPGFDPSKTIPLHNPKSQEPVTLDFLDAELENDIKVEIRKKMIDGESGDRTFTTLVKSQDERYIDKGNRTYTWTAVNGTDYSLALVLPSYSFYYIKAALNEPLIQAKFTETLKLDRFDEFGYTFLAPRDYCSPVKITDNNTAFLLNFSEFIDRYTPQNPSCNDMVMRALLDAGFTSELVQNYWSKQDPEGIRARFVATDGGITRVYPKSAGEYWTENAETYEMSFYKRSLDNENYVFTAPFYNRSISEDGVMVSKAVKITVNGKLLKPAVVGVKINVTTWMDNFTKITTKNEVQCKSELCGCEKNSVHVDCVILDDGGFLLMTNQEDYLPEIGKFFGEIDPGLMRNLINMSLYAFNKSYDYQSVCDPEEEPRPGAGLRSVHVPTIADLLHLGWWASAAAWSILQQLFLGLTFPRFLSAVEMEDEDLSAIPSKQSCITVQTQYFFANDEKSFNGILDCINCSRLFHAEKISNTNLVFIMSDSKDMCRHCDARPLMQAEKPDEGPNPCEMVQQPRYRKGPEVCFDDAPNDQPICTTSRASAMTSAPIFIFLQVFMWCGWRIQETVVESLA